MEEHETYKSPHTPEQQKDFMKRAATLALEGCSTDKGGPFGCVIVKDGKIIGEGSNQVTSTNDPSAHAEIVAIRNACKHLNNFQLTGCEIYTSCEPCPMCLGAIYWARPAAVFYGNTKVEAAKINFDDAFIYEELSKPYNQRSIPTFRLAVSNTKEAFEYWKEKKDKVDY